MSGFFLNVVCISKRFPLFLKIIFWAITQVKLKNWPFEQWIIWTIWKVGWAYENWLQENFGVEDDTPIEIEEEEEEIESFDVDSLKPGINLHKIKIADWKVKIHKNINYEYLKLIFRPRIITLFLVCIIFDTKRRKNSSKQFTNPLFWNITQIN